MRVRFTGERPTRVPGGPLYHPGDEAIIEDGFAAVCLRHGWAEEAPEKAAVRPPTDKMFRGTVRK